MTAIISLLLIVGISILVTRVAAEALTLTGVTRELARFQARSAFTGVGFTTREAEQMMNHPIRRRIIMTLMLLGNIGIVSAMSSLILGFVSAEPQTSALLKLGTLLVGIAMLSWLATSRWVDKYLSKLISWGLKRYADIDVRDYATLLRISGEYRISEILVKEEDWLAGQTLRQLKLREEGLAVLGVQKPKATYIGAPQPDTKICAGDILLVYGRRSTLAAIDQRRKGWTGDVEHSYAMREQTEVVEEEKQVLGEKPSPSS